MKSGEQKIAVRYPVYKQLSLPDLQNGADTEREGGKMTCQNIIIVVGSNVEKDTSLAAAEVRKAANQLKAKYADRKIFYFQFDHENVGTNATKIEEIVKDATNRSADTGMYLIGHGQSGSGMLSPMSSLQSDPCVFARAVCTFAEKGFHIKKICVLCCEAVKLEEGEPSPVPYKLEIEKGIYVQTICRALSEVDQNGKLQNIMVAGYSCPVFVWDPTESKDATKKRDYAKAGLKLTSGTNDPKPRDLMRPRLPQGRIRDEEREAYQKRLKEYAKNKIVYKLSDGCWLPGKLSEYTDHRDEWRGELIEQEKIILEESTAKMLQGFEELLQPF